jgi:hypothetical protein
MYLTTDDGKKFRIKKVDSPTTITIGASLPLNGSGEVLSLEEDK